MERLGWLGGCYVLRDVVNAVPYSAWAADLRRFGKVKIGVDKLPVLLYNSNRKGKTSNGYAKTLRLFRKITLMLCKGWRYFFMVNANNTIDKLLALLYNSNRKGKTPNGYAKIGLFFKITRL